MSRYKGNHEKCPNCGITYEEFRTGFKYRDIYLMLWDWSDNPDDWKYKRRGTVLGMWHQLKKEMWERHIDCECMELEESLEDDDVPF